MREHVRHDDNDSFLGIVRRDYAEHRHRARADMIWLFVAVIVWIMLVAAMAVVE